MWFRVLFNCRFYYPVLAIFFVDLGLTLSQFVILNGIWALTIVLLEVPSGALADLIGRKRLVVGSAILMVFEMLFLLLAPTDGGWWLFSLCALNRFFAGVAEAAASGADEALAYDSLKGEDKDKQWDEVLCTLGRRYALTMAFAMMIGALVYDSQTFSWLNTYTGIGVPPSSLLIRLPILLCLIQGILAICVAVRMKEQRETTPKKVNTQLFQQTFEAIQWLWLSKAALVLILGGVMVDSLSRNFATLTSSYYRYIEIPEFTFGFIGAGISLIAFTVPYYAKPLAQKFGIVANVLAATATSAVGLTGIALCTNFWGILPAILIMMSLYHIRFIMSRFLNQLTGSKIRATVLSVKGLIFNLGYAGFSFLFAQTLAIRTRQQDFSTAYQDVLWLTPLFLLFIFIIFILLAWRIRPRPENGDF